MMQPMHDPPPLAGPGFAGIREWVFVRRAVYVCRADICLNCGRCQKSCPTGAILRTVQLTTE